MGQFFLHRLWFTAINQCFRRLNTLRNMSDQNRTEQHVQPPQTNSSGSYSTTSHPIYMSDQLTSTVASQDFQHGLQVPAQRRSPAQAYRDWHETVHRQYLRHNPTTHSGLIRASSARKTGRRTLMDDGVQKPKRSVTNADKANPPIKLGDGALALTNRTRPVNSLDIARNSIRRPFLPSSQSCQASTRTRPLPLSQHH